MALKSCLNARNINKVRLGEKGGAINSAPPLGDPLFAPFTEIYHHRTHSERHFFSFSPQFMHF